MHFPFEVTAIPAKETQIHWTYYLKEAVFSQAFEDSVAYREYLAWLSDLKLFKLSQENPIVYTQIKREQEEQERIRKEKEAQAKLIEEEKNAKSKPGAKAPAAAVKPDPKKDAGKKGAAADPKKASDLQLSEGTLAAPITEQKADVPSAPAKTKPARIVCADWRPLEIVNKQLKALPFEARSEGVFLEAYIDEIETKFNGGLQSQLHQTEGRNGTSAHQLTSRFPCRMVSK